MFFWRLFLLCAISGLPGEIELNQVLGKLLIRNECGRRSVIGS
jgi:hypothetical protein